MDKWYSGKYDRAFKEVMLKESNRDLLTMLLEHILKIKINKIIVLNVEKIMGNIHIKGQRLDLNLETNIGKINVEVNSNYKKTTPSRNFSYFADLYSHDVSIGDTYNIIKEYIQINLSYGLNKDIIPIDIYKILNKDGKPFIDNFTIYNINMDYYKNLIKEKDTKKINDDIILVMLGQERDDLKKLSKNNKVVSKYMKELDTVNEEPEFREYMSYEREQELLRNTERQLGKEEGFNEAKRQFIDLLLSNGLSKEDIEQKFNINPDNREYMSYEREQELLRNTENQLGKEEITQAVEQSKKEIVINLLSTNMSISEISKIVNLPEEEIIKIRDSK